MKVYTVKVYRHVLACIIYVYVRGVWLFTTDLYKCHYIKAS